MKLISWNVNGLRACVGKGFCESMEQLDADIRFPGGAAALVFRFLVYYGDGKKLVLCVETVFRQVFRQGIEIRYIDEFGNIFLDIFRNDLVKVYSELYGAFPGLP